MTPQEVVALLRGNHDWIKYITKDRCEEIATLIESLQSRLATAEADGASMAQYLFNAQ